MTRSPSCTSTVPPPWSGRTIEQSGTTLRRTRHGRCHSRSGATGGAGDLRHHRRRQVRRPDPAGRGRGDRAARPLQQDGLRSADPADPVHRQDPCPGRPARAGGVLPAAAGDHRGQPDGQHRHRRLLPGDQPAGRGLPDQQLHRRCRAADHHHAAQRGRRHDAGTDADLPRPDQRAAARRARRGHRPLGPAGGARRAAQHRPAAVDPGLDGEADARRPGEARDDPHRRGQPRSRRSSRPRARSRRRSCPPRAPSRPRSWPPRPTGSPASCAPRASAPRSTCRRRARPRPSRRRSPRSRPAGRPPSCWPTSTCRRCR